MKINIRKRLSQVCLLCFILIISGILIPETFAEDYCVDCHKDSKFRVHNKMLFDYYNNWKDSIHDIAGVKCIDCHGGNPKEKDKDTAHKGDFRRLTAEDRGSYKEIPRRCGKCHENVLKNFVESKHYKALIEKENGPHCSTCHGSVNTVIYYTSIVENTCIACHNEETKISPEIIGTAKNILQRINTSRAYRQWTSIYYSSSDPAKVKEIDSLYMKVADSWHTFDFERLDEKSAGLLHELKSIVKAILAEKRAKGGEK
jgi:formate-dependent nitrite reductase cytochrome c552 subunit